MLSRRLVDGLLVAVARRVQRWADRILAERDRGLQAAQQAPRGSEASSEASSETDPPDGDGPPAHWLEMVRARAPHLLSPTKAPSPRPATTPSTWPQPPSMRSRVAEAPTANPAHQDRDASAPVPVHPSPFAGQIARQPASAPAELAKVPPRAAPPASAWSSPPTRGSSSIPAPAPSEARTPPQEPARWKWRIEPAGETPPARWRSAPSPAQAEAAPARPLRPHSPRPAARSPVAHPLVPHDPAAPWRASEAPAAPILAETPTGAVVAELSSPASARVAPPVTPSAMPASAGAEPLAARIPAVTPARTVPLNVPVNVPVNVPLDVPLNDPPPRSFDRARDVLQQPHRDPPRAARSVVWPHLSEEDGPRLPDDDELRERDVLQPARRSLPPARPDLWPRLPDEEDSQPQAWPTDSTWPVLPGDVPAALEAQAHEEDHGRSDRLRGEQQGARWSERHS
jgi:hypothetical protein